MLDVNKKYLPSKGNTWMINKAREISYQNNTWAIFANMHEAKLILT